MKKLLYILIVLTSIVVCHAVRREKIKEKDYFVVGDARGSYRVYDSITDHGNLDAVYITITGVDPNDVLKQWSRNELEDLINAVIEKRGKQ